MARIFYYTATGEIHGVHPGPFSGVLPDGIDFIDVTESPDKIVWLDARGEKFARVQGGVLVAFGAPLPEPTATGAQMIDEAEERGKLNMLTNALTPAQMAIFVTRRRIVAGSNFAEVLRGKLNVSASVMESFVAAAANRAEE